MNGKQERVLLTSFVSVLTHYWRFAIVIVVGRFFVPEFGLVFAGRLRHWVNGLPVGQVFWGEKLLAGVLLIGYVESAA